MLKSWRLSFPSVVTLINLRVHSNLARMYWDNTHKKYFIFLKLIKQGLIFSSLANIWIPNIWFATITTTTKTKLEEKWKTKKRNELQIYVLVHMHISNIQWEQRETLCIKAGDETSHGRRELYLCICSERLGCTTVPLNTSTSVLQNKQRFISCSHHMSMADPLWLLTPRPKQKRQPPSGTLPADSGKKREH